MARGGYLRKAASELATRKCAEDQVVVNAHYDKEERETREPADLALQAIGDALDDGSEELVTDDATRAECPPPRRYHPACR